MLRMRLDWSHMLDNDTELTSIHVAAAAPCVRCRPRWAAVAPRLSDGGYGIAWPGFPEG